MPSIVLIVHNVRSAHNVGSLLRSADGLGVDKVYLTGYTPYPKSKNDRRLPHLARRQHHQISKTALGAEKTVAWSQRNRIIPLLLRLKKDGYKIASLEQTDDAINLTDYLPPAKVTLIAGSETTGIDKDVLNASDVRIKIPMRGSKESLNVSVAAAIALYYLSTL